MNPTRQKINAILNKEGLKNLTYFGRTKGYAISTDGSASYSININNTHAGSAEQEQGILIVCKLLKSHNIKHNVEQGDGGHLEVVLNISNPSK